MVSFIILHYKNISDTIELLDSIKKLNYKDVSIIIVDNNSLLSNEEEILKKYTEDIIKLDSNLGFAKANNIGCSYAILKYNPDFLIVSNNDIVINDVNIINKIYKNYYTSKFDILGPKINTTNGSSANPFYVYKTSDEVLKQIKKTKRLIIIYKSFILRNLLNLYFKIKYLFLPKKVALNGDVKQFNVALHCCFIVFSKNYYEKYKHIFYNDTFLYHEECFIYQRIIKDNLISLYDPDISVYHKEGASLNFNFKNNYKKLIFKNEEILKSLELLLKQM